MIPACPVCGSKNTSEETVRSSISVPYGPPSEYEEVVNSCSDCDQCGDFESKNDTPISEAIARSNQAAVVLMLDNLSSTGVSNAYFERALRIPARTAARWKSGSASAAAVALLRLIRTFPWLLEVADNNFDPATATRELLNAAGTLLAPTMKHDDPPRVYFPGASLTGGDCSNSENLPQCPQCGTVMIVIEKVAAHCPDCCYKQKYPWRIPSGD